MNKDSQSNSSKSGIDTTALLIIFSATIFTSSGKTLEKMDSSEVQDKIIAINKEKREELKNISWEEASEQTKHNPELQTPETVLEEDSLLDPLSEKANFLQKKFDSMYKEFLNCLTQCVEIGVEIEVEKRNGGNISKQQLQKQNDLKQRRDSLEKSIAIVCKDLVNTKLNIIDLQIKRAKLLQKKAREKNDLDSLKRINELLTKLIDTKQRLNSANCKLLGIM